MAWSMRVTPTNTIGKRDAAIASSESGSSRLARQGLSRLPRLARQASRADGTGTDTTDTMHWCGASIVTINYKYENDDGYDNENDYDFVDDYSYKTLSWQTPIVQMQLMLTPQHEYKLQLTTCSSQS